MPPLSDSSDDQFPRPGKVTCGLSGGPEVTAQGSGGEGEGGEGARFAGREGSTWRTALSSGKIVLSQKEHRRAVGINPFQVPLPRLPGGSAEAGVLGAAPSGREMMREGRGQPREGLCTGTSWPAGGPVLSRLPVAFSCPALLIPIFSRKCRERGRGHREASLLRLAGELCEGYVGVLC